MKDNFSIQSAIYSKFRPSYPEELVAFLASQAIEKKCCLDVATGNGQMAALISNHFDRVFATDISEAQLSHAIKKPNVFYSMQPADAMSFDDASFDLITVAQAIHWFDFDRFYDEVRRLIKPNGIFAAIGYGLMKTGPESDKIIEHFYHNIIGPYWDPERKFVDEGYQTIPFPFKEIPTPKFNSEFSWSVDQLTGYLSSWSATRHYIEKNASDPIDLIAPQLYETWGQNERKVTFPNLLRVGKPLK